MKATGIVRRIDDLGRVVIPKEIRRTLRLREADPLEIFTDKDGEIILKKYSPIGDLGGVAKDMVEVLASVSGFVSLVCDQDQVIAASGKGAKEYLGKSITKELEGLILGRKKVTLQEKKSYELLSREGVKGQIIFPIISAGDAVGAVMLLEDEKQKKTNETQEKLVQLTAEYLGKIMEN